MDVATTNVVIDWVVANRNSLEVMYYLNHVDLLVPLLIRYLSNLPKD